MAKKKHSRSQPARGFGSKQPTAQPIAELRQVEALMERRRWGEAYGLLEKLRHQYPNNVDVLTGLVNVCYDLQDFENYQRACEQLLEVDPKHPEALYGLAGAYLVNLHPLLSLQTYRRALQRYPHHERASQARKQVADLESRVDSLLADLNLAGEEGFEVALLHEQGQTYLEQGEFKKARQAEEAVLRLMPSFVSARNNLSLINFMEGNVAGAIAAAQQVLESQPDNIHALSNLTRYSCVIGELEQAKPFAERLQASQAKAWDGWTKKVEGLSCLGDDQGILDVFEQAKASGDVKPSSPTSPMFYHLVAVAMMRLGQPAAARRQWQQALQRSPNFSLAQANLDDLKQPVGQRHAPWAFDLGYWITKQMVIELASALTSKTSEQEPQTTETTRRYLARHPHLLKLLPILLERGDPKGREFALRLALAAKTPETLTALRDFALSDRGPDEMRSQAANAVAEAGLLASDAARLWLKGEWREILLVRYEFHDEPTVNHSPQVKELLGEALTLMKGKGGKEAAARAEQLLKQALDIEPDSPDLLNNLAASYEIQGRSEAAQALIHQIAEQFPDYVFTQAALARMYLDQGKTEEAEAVLKPLLSRKRFHFDEFSQFCDAYIKLLVTQKNLNAARAWLNLWEGVDPDHPAITAWKLRLKLPGLLRGRS